MARIVFRTSRTVHLQVPCRELVAARLSGVPRASQSVVHRQSGTLCEHASRLLHGKVGKVGR
jgi:hypothetical protein